MLTMGCCRSKVTVIDQNAGICSDVKIVANAPINKRRPTTAPSSFLINTLPIPNESDEQLEIQGKGKVSKFNDKISIVQNTHLHK